ncbi:hypothetical protein AOQ84DRAFT_380425 [Glonium stellatum]|uniref:Uncharacterized protein n=1 Tax=Glonium stellatum TaxID=574774 RepID=A0A8E2ETG9_9PEZI|nr:hypothetical protein AOQ84DRAFT_380425 [Glonium stellatum]
MKIGFIPPHLHRGFALRQKPIKYSERPRTGFPVKRNFPNIARIGRNRNYSQR